MDAASVLKPGFCTLCRSRCGTLNEVRGEALVSVRPDPAHPTGAAICMKGRAAPELVHSPHRLRHPMRRTRPKGDPDPGWVRITWDEALDETAARLGAIKAESGAEAVAFGVTTPSGTPLSDSIEWIERFIRLFGSPNTVYATELCNWHKDVAHVFTWGCGIQPADYAQADLVMLWGHNPSATWLAQAQAVARGRAAGARMLVVDPRPTPLARQAEVWAPVRPATDAALALGLMHLLIEGGGIDEAFVRDWTNAPLLVREDTGAFLRARDLDPAAGDAFMVWRDGAPAPYDTRRAASGQGGAGFALRGQFTAGGHRVAPVLELLARAAAAWPPARVAEVTGAPEAAIRAAAALIAGAKRIALHGWTGIGQHTNATQTDRAIATLYALTGAFDRAGGNRRLGAPAFRPVNGIDLMDPAQRAKALGLAERPLGPPASGWITARDACRAILEGEPYPVRALVGFGGNLPVSHADAETGRRALEALEFHVHCDLFETPAAAYADILLPIGTPWEREGLRIGFEIDPRAAGHVQLRQRMVPPQGEARSDNEVVFALATRLGLGEAFFGGDIEAGWNHMLAPLGLTVADLRARPEGVARPVDDAEAKHARETADGVQGFATETRRVELYSELLLRHGQPALPTFTEPADSPRDPARTQGGRFPLVLTSAKNPLYCHSQHRSLASLRRRAPVPVAEIGPGLAAARGIAEGDWLRVTTRAGRARFAARIMPGLADDVVCAEYGWWQACPELGRDGAPETGEGSSNFNALIASDDHDPVSGSVAHRSFLCDVALDPDTRRGWAGWRAFRVAGLRAEGTDVLALRFEAADGGGAPDHLPGQHVGLRLPGDPAERAYSLIGPAVEADRSGYAVAVRRLPGGALSARLHATLAVGDVVELRAPSGGFTLPVRSPQPLVLMAGGIGVTPFLGLLESLAGRADAPEVWLWESHRSPAARPFAARLAALAGPRVRVVTRFTSEGPRLSAADVPADLIARRARFHLCGPVAMMDGLTAGLVARGVPAFDIFREAFRSPAAAPADGAAARVTFARSGRTATWTPARGTLLQLAEAEGLSPPSGCRTGQCESCAMRVLAGRVRHLHGAEPEDPDACLACQAVPVGDVTLDA